MFPITLLVADDHEIVRKAIVGLLADVHDIDVVAEAADGEEAVRLALELRPRVIVMDLDMPKLDGVEATRRILAEAPSTRVLILTAFPDAERSLSALRAGAVAYLLKDRSAADLVDAIMGAVYAAW